MSMDKKVNIPLETTAQYQSLSKLNVQFWNQDRETAILQFRITKNDYPLSLSEENVKVFIALESGDSFLVDDKLDFVDQLNGVVSYTIPTDFMKVATQVKGQVYVTTLDEEEVVVQRQFTFDVANDLIADLPAEDKIREIKYFSDMRAEVAQMMAKLNSDFEHMNDYVTQVQDTTQAGIAALTKLIDDKEKAYNDNHTAKMQELNDKGTEYSTKFDEDKQYMDEKFEAFKSSVNGSGLVTTGQSTNWQKYKLTNDDGTRQYLKKGTIKDITTLAPGSYETVSDDDPTSQGLPSSLTNTYLQIDITAASGDTTRKRIEVTSSFKGKVFYRIFHTDGENDTGWKEIALIDTANPFETTTGAQDKATTAENNAKVYTDTVASEINEVIFKGSAKGVGATLTLNKPFTDYDELKIFAYGHGAAECYVRDTDPSRKIIMYSFNLTDSDYSNGDIVETQVERTNSTSFKIVSVGSYNFPTATGTTNSSLGLEIYKIVGVKYFLKGVDDLTPVGSDKYATMTQLMTLTTEGTDWKIETNKVTNANTLVSAIHGGGIEAGTTELAKLTSEISKQNYYSFMGIRSTNNSELHVTSTRYDEPTLLRMLNVPYTVSIHGASGTDKIIYLGGADTDNMAIMRDKLTQAGFNVQTPTAGIEGGKENNIVNKNTRNKGIQLELTTALRQSLFVDNNYGRTNREDRTKWSADMTKLATAISDAIKLFKQ